MTYKPDKIYEAKSNEKIADLNIQWSTTKINHLFALCGDGKTYNAKQIANPVIDDIDFLFGERTMRVCFISPLKSINKDSFENIDNWVIVDGDHKQTNKYIVGSTSDILASKYNVCTTWESFVAYKMYDIDFDYVIMDEVHCLYMYDYRMKSVADIKKYFPMSKGIKIVMTGTPSYEIKEFDCYKIQVLRKDAKKIKCEIWEYDPDEKKKGCSIWGNILNDIKKWTKDEKHQAVIFYDYTNYNTEEMFRINGMQIKIFNKNYLDNVESILGTERLDTQVTGFSVYGQAGINIYIDDDKKVRIYVMSNNSLAIIQYANRVRNKECIDKVIVPNPHTISLRTDDCEIEYEEVLKHVDDLNAIQVPMDIRTDDKFKNIIFNRFGLQFEYLNHINATTYELNKDVYNAYERIRIICDYECGLDRIRHRLEENNYDITTKNIELKRLESYSKLASNRFAGQIVRMDFDMIKENKDGSIWLKPDNEKNKQFVQICTGEIKNNIEYILNILYEECDRDIAVVENKWHEWVNNLIKDHDTVYIADLDRYKLFLYIQKHWNEYYNTSFINVIKNTDTPDEFIAAAYVRSVYVDGIDWKLLCEESLGQIRLLRKIIETYPDAFDGLTFTKGKTPAKDDKFDMFLGYLQSKTRGRKARQVEVGGKTYANVATAAAVCGVSERTFKRWIKSGKAKYVSENVTN